MQLQRNLKSQLFTAILLIRKEWIVVPILLSMSAMAFN